VTRITFVGELYTGGGYGQHSIEVIRWLESNGYFVSVRPMRSAGKIPQDITSKIVRRIQPESLELMLCPPHHLPTKGKRTVYFTMWESTRLRPESALMLNKAELVVVPSQWCKTSFIESGVKSPISVVPLGIDPKIFNHAHPLTLDNETRIFGAAGNLANGYSRKGLDDIIAAFRMAFRNGENVILRLKTSKDVSPRNPKDGRIQLNNDLLTDEEMADWFHGIDYFVSASKSEGFGLMTLQAMACGRPCIAPIYSGMADYLNYNNCLAMNYSIVPAGDAWIGCGDWCQPSVNSIAQKMRLAYMSREHMMVLGHTAAINASGMTWDMSNTLLNCELGKL
jgi:glycosyltransferase involved in cell wall biosynthesis